MFKFCDNKTFKNLIPLLLCAIFLSSCDALWKPKSPHGYIMPRPQMMILEKKLDEISGLFYLNDKDVMIAIADNKNKIYQVTTDGQISDFYKEKFATQEDFEDLVMVNEIIYVLISNGTILAIEKSDTALSMRRFPFWSTENNDFETLYYEPEVNALVMICKSCEHEKGTGVLTAYKFDLSSKHFDSTAYYTIKEKEVKDILKDGNVKVNPSAAAIHPLENRLYVLSSAGNLLIVTDLKGNVQEAFRLNPTLYPQAEGIAFAPNGDMFISNEAKLGKPTLLKLVYNQRQNQTTR